MMHVLSLLGHVYTLLVLSWSLVVEVRQTYTVVFRSFASVLSGIFGVLDVLKDFL